MGQCKQGVRGAFLEQVALNVHSARVESPQVTSGRWHEMHKAADGGVKAEQRERGKDTEEQRHRLLGSLEVIQQEWSVGGGS